MGGNWFSRRSAAHVLVGRLVSGFGLALVIALSVFMLLNASKANNVGFASLWFLAALPAFLCALICYIGDPHKERSGRFYWLVPPVLVGLVDLGSVFFLHEGVICLIMLSPIWLGAGWAGAFFVRSLRRKRIGSNVVHSSLIIVPLLMGIVESQIPRAHDQVLVARRVVVHASPARIWPYLVSNRFIGPREGRWNFTQNILGVPRPRATVISGRGVGAVRTAWWGDRINFEERITRWAPGEVLGWTFRFSNASMQNYTDKHVSPDGEFLKIDSGDYMMRPLSPETTELTLNTRYIAKTHVNLYAEAWGEILMGDIQNNILAIVKDRAEARHARAF